MSGMGQSPAVSEGKLPPPPKELPSFFTQQQKPLTFSPPMPPQFHPTIESAPVTSSSNPQNAETSGVVLPPASSVPISFPPVSASAPAYLLPNPSPSHAPPLASTVKQLMPISTGGDEVVNLAKMDSKSTAPPSEQIVVPASGSENGVQSTEINDEEEGSGVLHWFQHTVRQYEFLSKVATKAKSGMDSVLTTLDPGMKGFLEGTDPLHAIILCTNSYVADAVRHGLRYSFSEILFGETPVETNFNNSLQIVGHDVAWKNAKERLSNFRNCDAIGQETALVVVQPFIYQIGEYWFDTALVLAQKGNVEVSVFTQSTQVDDDVITLLQKHTPKDYPSGKFATTVGCAYVELYGGDPSDWQENLLSFSSIELYRAAAVALAANLKRMLSKEASK